MERLWTPWRMNYVTGTAESTSGGDRARIFLDALDDADNPDSLVVHRGTAAFVIMNLFPYNTGHMMVVPNRRVASLADLNSDERAELMELVSEASDVATQVLNCDGLNIGLNIGAVGGAGIADHLHVHIVPRWMGDANFMPITASTMVLPELLPATSARVKGEFHARTVALSKPSFSSTAGALVYLPEDDRFVLRVAKDGSIVIPKGHIEAGESAAEAAVREVAEETGYHATVSHWGGTETFEHAGRSFHAIYFLAVGVPTPEIDDHRGRDTILVSPDDLTQRVSFASLRALAERAVAVMRR